MPSGAQVERTERAGPAPLAREVGPRRWSSWRQNVLPFVTVLVPLVVVAWCFWPGHMSNDSLAQIEAARTGDFTNQHAPILVALWRPFYELGFGPGWVLCLQLVAFAGGCWLLLRTALSRLAAALATAAICLSPPVFGMLGYVSRDLWFTALLLVTFGATARALSDQRHRRLWVAVALAAAWFTLASRQNAAPAVLVALAILALPYLERFRGRGRRAVAALAAGLLATVALMITQFGVNAALGVRDVDPEQYLMIYDLAALSHRERTNLFPPEVMPQRGVAVIDRYWNVDVVNPYLFSPDPPIRTPLSPDQMSELRDAWLDAIGDHPFQYLAARTEIQARQLGIGRSAVWVYHPGIDANGFGFKVRNTGANETARDSVEGFAQPNLDGRIPFYVLWLYLLIAVAAGIAVLRLARRAPQLMAVGGLGIAVLAFQSGLFLGAMGVGYRLEFPMVVAALVCGIVAIAAVRVPR